MNEASPEAVFYFVDTGKFETMHPILPIPFQKQLLDEIETIHSKKTRHKFVRISEKIGSV